jgi:ABC-type sulfate transport system substrate-binding protein
MEAELPMKRILLISLFLLLTGFSFGQAVKDSKPNKGFVVKTTVVDGDTIPSIELPPAIINDFVHLMTPSERWEWERLVRNVRKVYPYAKMAGAKFKEYNAIVKAAHSEQEKRRLMKKAEVELKAEFEGQLKDLTVTQGKILVKLVYRETGNTTYDIVKELRGVIVAFFWQNLGRIFAGYNLKVQYSPQGEDHQIETIIYMMENGRI